MVAQSHAVRALSAVRGGPVAIRPGDRFGAIFLRVYATDTYFHNFSKSIYIFDFFIFKYKNEKSAKNWWRTRANDDGHVLGRAQIAYEISFFWKFKSNFYSSGRFFYPLIFCDTAMGVIIIFSYAWTTASMSQMEGNLKRS